ncbi:MAG TPA: VOC family protein [Candidatus Binataceae bacterium]|nr:VOC family protein [Candidatus Binataceae bacterium]
MSTHNSFTRDGFGQVRPYLFGRLDLADFIRTVFGAQELSRHKLGDKAFHIEARIGDSVVVLEVADPPHAAGKPNSTYVYVPNVDAAYKRALGAGATTMRAPADQPYDERNCGVVDSFGNTWWIATMLNR